MPDREEGTERAGGAGRPGPHRGSAAWKAGIALYVLGLWLFFLFLANASGILDSPPEKGDGTSYDEIGYNLALGRGFGENHDDPDWRKPYEEGNASGEYDDIVYAHGSYRPTYYRPPLLPVILAIIYRIDARDFRVWRVLSLLLLCAAAGIACLIARDLGGTIPSIAVAAMPLFDAICRSYSSAYLTESLAACGVALLTLMLLMLPRRLRHVPAAGGIGLVTGLLILSRSVFILWLPFLAMAVWAQIPSGSKKGKGALVFIAVSLLTISPWCIRNMRQLGPQFPLGSQGAINLSSAYSDAAMESRGLFPEIVGKKPPLEVERSPEEGDYNELREAIRGGKIFRRWIASNWPSLPRLAAMRLSSLFWRDAVVGQRLLLLGSLLGLFVLLRLRGGWVLLVPVFCSAAATTLTWSVPGGRFLIPIHPILWVVVSLNLLYILRSKRALLGHLPQ